MTFQRMVDIVVEVRPASSKGQKYILVEIDYFIKWIEAIPLGEYGSRNHYLIHPKKYNL